MTMAMKRTPRNELARVPVLPMDGILTYLQSYLPIPKGAVEEWRRHLHMCLVGVVDGRA